jgi:hypothetical protein
MNDCPLISLMLAVPDAQAASAWHQRALGATKLWDLGSVVGMEIDGAFFPGEPEHNGWELRRSWAARRPVVSRPRANPLRVGFIASLL